MPELPSGIVTFLFTDLEGSTRLSRELGEKFNDVMHQQRLLLTRLVELAGGVVYGFFGDASSAVFETVAGAVAAAAASQHAFAATTWSDGVDVRVRIGIHSGRATAVTGEYLGLDVHRTARICAAAHGGQVLLSEAAHNALDPLPAGVTFRDLGGHELKGLSDCDRLFQLLIAGLHNDFPPLRVGTEGATTRTSARNARELARSLQHALIALRKRRHASTLNLDNPEPSERGLGLGAGDFTAPRRNIGSSWPKNDLPL